MSVASEEPGYRGSKMATWIRWLGLGLRKDISTRCTTRHETTKRSNCMGGLTATGATNDGTLAESGALTLDVSCSLKQHPQCSHGLRQALCFEGCEEFFN